MNHRDDELAFFVGLRNAILIALVGLVLILAPYHLVVKPMKERVERAACPFDQCR